MKEEIKNLTPEMVEELKQLGVEFEDTQMVWSCFKPTMELLDEYPLSTRRKYKEENTIFIPAPNLSEVLKMLPKCISKIDIYGEPRDFIIELQGRTKGGWYISYDDEPVERLAIKYNKSALIAAYELLKWVATNYPKSLKGGHRDE